MDALTLLRAYLAGDETAIMSRAHVEAVIAEIEQYNDQVRDLNIERAQARAELAAERERAAELEAEVRFAYLECEGAVQHYDYESDLEDTDVCGMIENMRHTIKAMRDIAIPDERYKRINSDDAAWRRMLKARAVLAETGGGGDE
jgi:hypothetical protein